MDVNEKCEKVCPGCVNDQPGQLEHMYCPCGCLHNINTCSICSKCLPIKKSK